MLDGDTIVPKASDAEAQALSAALQATHESGAVGPREHLKLAGEELTRGRWASSIRESIHAVEATAKIVEPKTNTLEPALTTLAKRGKIHPALRAGFLRLYDFTSDEKGIRHSLLDKAEAEIDETDAVYMLGACAAFVPYLLRRTRGE